MENNNLYTPKDGDFVCGVNDGSSPFIFKESSSDLNNGIYGCYCGMINEGHIYINIHGYDHIWATKTDFGDLRPASYSEICKIRLLLKENKTSWDPINKNFDKYCDYNTWHTADEVPEGEEPYVLAEDYGNNFYVAGYDIMENNFIDLHKGHFDDKIDVKRWKYLNTD